MSEYIYIVASVCVCMCVLFPFSTKRNSISSPGFGWTGKNANSAPDTCINFLIKFFYWIKSQKVPTVRMFFHLVPLDPQYKFRYSTAVSPSPASSTSLLRLFSLNWGGTNGNYVCQALGIIKPISAPKRPPFGCGLNNN